MKNCSQTDYWETFVIFPPNKMFGNQLESFKLMSQPMKFILLFLQLLTEHVNEITTEDDDPLKELLDDLGMSYYQFKMKRIS